MNDITDRLRYPWAGQCRNAEDEVQKLYTLCRAAADALEAAQADSRRLDWLEAWHTMGDSTPGYGDVGIAMFGRTSDGWITDAESPIGCEEFDSLRAAIDAASTQKEPK